MNIKFAEASISETGGINGKKGDQANEVRISNPYNHSKGWRFFIHPNANVNKWVGINGRVMAQNQHFGYGQSDRVSGYTACKNAGWEPANVKIDCNVDCSEMARTAVACAMEKDIADFNTANEASVLMSVGYTEIKNWTLSTLPHGAIGVTKTKGHSVIVTDMDVTAKSSSTTSSYYPKYTGSSNSVDVVMGAIGATNDYDMSQSKKYMQRLPIARANGYANYSGTLEQNVALCTLAKSGTLKRP